MGEHDVYMGLPVEKVKQQCEGGLYIAKRIGFFMKKIAAIEEKYATELLKVITHEAKKPGRYDDSLQMGKRPHTDDVWHHYLDVMEKSALSHQKYAIDLASKLVQPSEVWWKKNNASLQESAGSEKKHIEGIQKQEKQAEKDKKECEMLLSQFRKDKENSKLKVKTEQAFSKHYNLIDSIRRDQKKLRVEMIPSSLQSMAELEANRLDETKRQLVCLGGLMGKLADAYVNEYRDLDLKGESINPRMELEDGVQQYLSKNPRSPSPQFALCQWDLSCSPAALKAGDFDDTSQPVFNTTDIEDDPNDKIPELGTASSGTSSSRERAATTVPPVPKVKPPPPSKKPPERERAATVGGDSSMGDGETPARARKVTFADGVDADDDQSIAESGGGRGEKVNYRAPGATAPGRGDRGASNNRSPGAGMRAPPGSPPPQLNRDRGGGGGYDDGPGRRAPPGGPPRGPTGNNSRDYDNMSNAPSVQGGQMGGGRGGGYDNNNGRGGGGNNQGYPNQGMGGGMNTNPGNNNNFGIIIPDGPITPMSGGIQ